MLYFWSQLWGWLSRLLGFDVLLPRPDLGPSSLVFVKEVDGMADKRTYKFTGFSPVPPGQDVSRQLLLVYVNTVLQEPMIEFPLDATEVEFTVPQDSNVRVVRRWLDDATPVPNYSDSSPAMFVARDEEPPPVPGSFGTLVFVREEDAAPSTDVPVTTTTTTAEDVTTTTEQPTIEPTTSESTTDIPSTTEDQTTADSGTTTPPPAV